MKSYAILIFALLVNSILQVVLLFVPKTCFLSSFFKIFHFFLNFWQKLLVYY